jgi:hypothetical protein
MHAEKLSCSAFPWHAGNMANEPKYSEGDPHELVTRGEFNEAMQMLARSFEHSRSDMQVMERKLLTELKAGQESFARQLEDWGKTLFEKIDVAVELRQIELGAAKSEQVEANTERLDQHEKRLSTVEQHIGHSN